MPLTPLKQLLTGSEERCGFLIDNQLVEVKNISLDPRNTFDVSSEDVLKHAEKAQAIWHTHPGASALLSMSDYMGFRQWPDLKHIVVGLDGIRIYEVAENGLVVEVETSKDVFPYWE